MATTKHACSLRCRLWGCPDAADDVVMVPAPMAAAEREASGTDAINSLLDASRDVLAAWESGDLAAAVRRLDAVVQDVTELEA